MIGYREWAIIPLSVLILLSLLTSRPHLFAMFCMLLVGMMSWNKISGIARKAARYRPNHTAKIVVSDLHPDRLISLFRPILRISILQGIQDSAEVRIKSYILRSGSAENPRILGIRSVLYPIISGIVMVPVGVAVSWHNAAFAGIMVIPLALFAFHFAMLKMRAGQRRSLIEDEIAPFATLASIMESVNVSLYHTFLDIARSPADIFPVMRKEGQRIRDVSALGRSPTEALLDLADSHPSTTFRDFVGGYVSSANTGGSDTARYLQEHARRFFKFMQNRMIRYTKQADMIAQVILTIMLLLPMMGLSMMFFATGSLAGTMMLLLIVTFPFITAILVTVVHAAQPQNRDSVRVSWAVFPVGISCGIMVHLAGGMVWEVIGAAVSAGCFFNMILVRKKFAEISSMEAPLPEFMRQVTRFKNIGIDIMHAMKSIRADIVHRERPKFNRTFDGMIDRLYRAMAAGSSLEQAVSSTPIRSWNARLIFFILGKVHESGGGTAKTLDDLTRWATEYADAKKEMVANLRGSLMTAFIGPVLMVMISAVSGQLTAEFESNSIAELKGMAGVSLSEDISRLSEVLTITSVVCMGIVLSKINYFTIRHTMFTGVITTTTMILLYAVPYLPEFEL